ncbi:DUF6574 domain-containing protein [Streptococcus marimammalium]|uniref:DUF6574 domain-containing protein n=1 Tax=Streptococcus marimammalium TaxID=269666 RepID=UPI0003642F04|nr:DUF6574 domain-containing protein [Streptococcus marimammalium]
MEKQDWLDYFEAVNGRSPEPNEIEVAKKAGEFVEEDSSEIKEQVSQEVNNTDIEEQLTQEENNGGVEEQVSQEKTSPEPEELQTQETKISDTEKPLSQVENNQNTAQPQAFSGSSSQQNNHVPFPNQNMQQPIQQTQQMQQVAPSPFSLFIKQFWQWLLNAWKSPTNTFPTHKYNGLTAFGLLVLFTTINILKPIAQFQSDGISLFISIVAAISLVFFSIIFGGFIVKRFVYNEKSFTFMYSFEWFGRLLSLNILFSALSLLFSFVNVYTVVTLLTIASYIVFGAATSFTIFHNNSDSNIDIFYKKIIASIIYFLIVAIIVSIALAIGGEMIFNGFFNNIENQISNFGGYGY